MERSRALCRINMKVIFMRHGQTSENAAHRHQPNKTELSPAGRGQSIAAAEKLRLLSPTHLISSPHNRTLQTASIIGQELDMIPSIAHNVRELERPRHLTGQKHFSLWSLLFYKFWWLGFAQGGESYKELRERVALAKDELAKLPEDAVVVVVSHTVFINLFLAHMNRERPLWPWQAVWTFWKLISMRNAALIELSVVNGRWTRT